MKAAARFKQFDFKQFLINHGEKIGMAVIGLLVVTSLWGTNWSRFRMSPEQMEEDAKSAEEAINKQDWPKAKMDSLAGQSKLRTKVDQLFTPVSAAQYALTVPFSPPLHPDNTKISNPHWLAIQDLRADSDFVELELDPSVQPLDEVKKFVRIPTEEEREKAQEERDKKKKEAKEKKKKRRGRKADDSSTKSEQKDEPAIPEAFKRIEGKGAGSSRMGFGGTGIFLKQKEKDRRKRKSSEPADEITPVSPVKKQLRSNGRGYRYVAVRGVFPLRAQVDSLMHALGDVAPTKRTDAQDLLEFRDFEIERQTAGPGPDLWTGRPWEPVDKDRVKEMLMNDVSTFAPETVDARITNNVLCMPYPERVVGVWGEMATHPAIKEFVLTDDEVDQQVKYQEELIRRFKDEEVKKKGEQSGWDQVTKDMRALERRAMRRQDAANTTDVQPKKSAMDQILDEIKSHPSADPAGLDQRLAEFVRKRGTAVDHLLLFRFLDFSVESGNTYRYRVKVILGNPFHTKQIEEVVDPSIVEGETRETDWSQPTKPVTVPEDAKFYVKRTEGHLGRSMLPNATMDLYQWFASTGTVVNKEIMVQIGQFLAGNLLAKVLLPSENTFNQQRVPFSTNCALVDVIPGFTLDQNLHGDIYAGIHSAIGKEGKMPSVRVPDQVLFVTKDGGLKPIDGLDQSLDYHQTQERLKYQNLPFKDLLDKDKKDDDAGQGIVDMRNMGSSKKKGKHRHDPRHKKGDVGN